MRMTSSKFKSPMLLLVSAAMLGGCGLFGDKEEDVPVYYRASETAALDVPEDLNKPRTDQKLTIEGEAVAQAGAVTASNFPPRVQVSVQAENSTSAMKYGARGTYLVIEDTTDSVYRRLKFAIERSGFQLLGENQADLSYDLYYTEPPKPKPEKSFMQKMAFWNKVEVLNYSGSYRALLEAEGESTRIYLQGR